MPPAELQTLARQGLLAVQPYGISVTDVTGAVVDMQVRGCNLNGSSGNQPLYVGAASTDLRVTDCDGYNDQGTILQTATPPPSGTFSNTSAWPNVSQGWYGPITFYIVGTNNNVSIGNATRQVGTHLSNGSFTLYSGEVAAIGNPSNVTNFPVIGE